MGPGVLNIKPQAPGWLKSQTAAGELKNHRRIYANLDAGAVEALETIKAAWHLDNTQAIAQALKRSAIALNKPDKGLT